MGKNDEPGPPVFAFGGVASRGAYCDDEKYFRGLLDMAHSSHPPNHELFKALVSSHSPMERRLYGLCGLRSLQQDSLFEAWAKHLLNKYADDEVRVRSEGKHEHSSTVSIEVDKIRGGAYDAFIFIAGRAKRQL
eukprot:TRINITY_DN3300_c0_g1_i2.p1 TRINITY_DN3300_c0_g1~~TRINITY_DN3300_c0_g1_i2.p1  ORF type:complete len:134 (+),score=19.00 TRINITY_DN3300_c0_g1_i2:259-660(+)